MPSEISSVAHSLIALKYQWHLNKNLYRRNRSNFMMLYMYPVSQKNRTLFLPTTFANVDYPQNSFTIGLGSDCVTKLLQILHYRVKI